MDRSGDRGVATKSSTLSNCRIAFAITGGIAAVDSIRIGRELRRHGAAIIPMMTEAAQRIVTSRAVEWGLNEIPITTFESGMEQLDHFDAVLVAPCTRNTLAKIRTGIVDHPLLMSIISARTVGSPVLLVPSMHDHLAENEETLALCQDLQETGLNILWGPHEEGRRKQPSPERIVGQLCNLISAKKRVSKNIAITVGGTRSAIDAVRYIGNSSTGRTGWDIADFLYREGHQVKVVEGMVEALRPDIPLDVTSCHNPESMLSAMIELAQSGTPPEVWIHAAAILDFLPEIEVDGKLESNAGPPVINLISSPKLIDELSPFLKDDVLRIGFKLGARVSPEEIQRIARKRISSKTLDAVIANRVEDLNSQGVRGWWISEEDGVEELANADALNCRILSSIDERW